MDWYEGWLERRRVEGAGALPALLLIAAGVAILVWLAWRLMPGHSSFTGRNLSALTLVDADGGRHTLAEYQGKVLVVDFWATWCPPCRMSLPELAALQAKQGDDYAVLPVSVDQRGFSDVTPFFQQNPQLHIDAMVPADPSALEAQVGRIEGIPTTLLVGRDGKVREALVGYSPGRLERELRAALGQ